MRAERVTRAYVPYWRRSVVRPSMTIIRSLRASILVDSSDRIQERSRFYDELPKVEINEREQSFKGR